MGFLSVCLISRLKNVVSDRKSDKHDAYFRHKFERKYDTFLHVTLRVIGNFHELVSLLLRKNFYKFNFGFGFGQKTL